MEGLKLFQQGPILSGCLTDRSGPPQTRNPGRQAPRTPRLAFARGALVASHFDVAPNSAMYLLLVTIATVNINFIWASKRWHSRDNSSLSCNRYSFANRTVSHTESCLVARLQGMLCIFDVQHTVLVDHRDTLAVVNTSRWTTKLTSAISKLRSLAKLLRLCNAASFPHNRACALVMRYEVSRSHSTSVPKLRRQILRL